MDERLERHLCNLHNEVFEAAESRINTECSLTIREGISDFQVCRGRFIPFPHYTWGYIGRGMSDQREGIVPSLYVRVYRKKRREFLQKAVPSLYVRVYRTGNGQGGNDNCSLTIREGISCKFLQNCFRDSFPHYTWGYIDSRAGDANERAIPSLYVRVYRGMNPSGLSSICSLIICEGILVIFASCRITHIKNVKIFQKNTKKGSQKYE